jgi:outer membrane protein OmpU
MNLKKIGVTALAGSLVATSLVAGEMSVTGSASMKVRNVAGNSAGKAFSMGNQLEFAGGGELDNGMNVSLNFVLDQNDDSTAVTSTAAGTGASGAYTGGPFDSHSVSISSDAMGTLVFHGEGGSSAQSAIDTTAAGDLWDNGYGITTTNDPSASATSDNMLFYTLPSMVDDLTVTASYTPRGAGAIDASASFGVGYTGVEGLSVNWATGEDNTAVATTKDVNTLKISYAVGSFTVGFSDTDYDSEDTAVTADQNVRSYNASYTVSENISVSYGIESISLPNDTTADHQDIEVSALTASYTAGGMTLSAMMGEADNTAHTTGAAEDKEMWHLVASFAF